MTDLSFLGRYSAIKAKFYPTSGPVAARPISKPENPLPPMWDEGMSRLAEIEAALASDEPQRPKTIRQIAKEVCIKHNLTFEALSGDGRTRHLSEARREYFVRCQRETKSSGAQASHYINKDHTTGLSAIRKQERLDAEEAARIDKGEA